MLLPCLPMSICAAITLCQYIAGMPSCQISHLLDGVIACAHVGQPRNHVHVVVGVIILERKTAYQAVEDRTMGKDNIKHSLVICPAGPHRCTACMQRALKDCCPHTKSVNCRLTFSNCTGCSLKPAAMPLVASCSSAVMRSITLSSSRPAAEGVGFSACTNAIGVVTAGDNISAVRPSPYHFGTPSCEAKRSVDWHQKAVHQPPNTPHASA